MSTIQQISDKAFLPLKNQAIDSSKEYVPVVSQTSVTAKYTIVDITVSAALQNTILNLPNSTWDNNTAVNIGQGEVGQEFTSLDNQWKYTCVSNGYWVRALIIQNKVQIYLDTLDDSTGLKTISEMNALYPSAVVLQRVSGVTGYYEKTVGDSWYFVNTLLANTATNITYVDEMFTITVSDATQLVITLANVVYPNSLLVYVGASIMYPNEYSLSEKTLTIPGTYTLGDTVQVYVKYQKA